MDKIDLQIEKMAYQEVIRQFSKGDARMCIQLDRFLKGIESKIKDIDIQLQYLK